MMRLLRFGFGLVAGVLLGGLGAWLADYFKGVDSPEALAARVRELEHEPARMAERLSERVESAIEEGRRAAAAAQVELQAARTAAPARSRGAGERKVERAGDRPADRVGRSGDAPV